MRMPRVIKGVKFIQFAARPFENNPAPDGAATVSWGDEELLLPYESPRNCTTNIPFFRRSVGDRTRNSRMDRVPRYRSTHNCERVVQCGTYTKVRAILRKIILYHYDWCCIIKKNKRSRRKLWCQEWLHRREAKGRSEGMRRELKEKKWEFVSELHEHFFIPI